MPLDIRAMKALIFTCLLHQDTLQSQMKFKAFVRMINQTWKVCVCLQAFKSAYQKINFVAFHLSSLFAGIWFPVFKNYQKYGETNTGFVNWQFCCQVPGRGIELVSA